MTISNPEMISLGKLQTAFNLSLDECLEISDILPIIGESPAVLELFNKDERFSFPPRHKDRLKNYIEKYVSKGNDLDKLIFSADVLSYISAQEQEITQRQTDLAKELGPFVNKPLIVDILFSSVFCLFSINKKDAVLMLHQRGYALKTEVKGLTKALVDKIIATSESEVKQGETLKTEIIEKEMTKATELPELICQRDFPPRECSDEYESESNYIRRVIKDNDPAKSNVKLWRDAGKSDLEIVEEFKRNGGGMAVIGALVSKHQPPSKEACRAKAKRILAKK